MVRAAFSVAAAASALFALASACLPPAPLLPPPDATVVDVPAPTSASCGDGILANLDDGGDSGEECDPGTDIVTGCTANCQITCSGIVGPAGHCYFLADTSDYVTALHSCTQAGGHVVTIDTDDEARLVRTLVGDGGSYRVGLSDDEVIALGYKTPNSEPGWPHADNRCPGCYARGTDDAGIFPIRSDAGETHPCLVAGPDDNWLQSPCSEANGADAGYAVVCEREPAGQRSTACGGPLCMTLPATAGQKRYVVSLGAATADEAAKFCADFDGGALTTLASSQEREQLARELRMLVPSERGSVEVWIGLTHTSAGWQWDDGSDAAPPWAEDEPSAAGFGRAFMHLDDNAFDTQLVKTDEDASTPQRIFVCQRPID